MTSIYLLVIWISVSGHMETQLMPSLSACKAAQAAVLQLSREGSMKTDCVELR